MPTSYVSHNRRRWILASALLSGLVAVGIAIFLNIHGAGQDTHDTPAASTGRSYPLHTNINATTFWVGEQFQSTADGSQVCSAYDAQWQYSFFHLNTGLNTADGCKGAPVGGCDAAKRDTNGACDDANSIASLRNPTNGYFPPRLTKNL